MVKHRVCPVEPRSATTQQGDQYDGKCCVHEHEDSAHRLDRRQDVLELGGVRDRVQLREICKDGREFARDQDQKTSDERLVLFAHFRSSAIQ